ncbi:MAG: RNA-binding protein [Vicinamibacteria bacterium]|nr:RNA-binding protein [Vicinamibacteria bacterium]
MGRKLYVGNLPFSMTDEGLTDLFAQMGAVESARIVRDQGTGQSRGFAFVEMVSDEDAQRAMQLNERNIDGRSIVVNEARPKTEGGRGRGGFGGGRGRGPGGGGGRGGGRGRW